MTGCSGATRAKWERFEYLLRVHAEMCRLIMVKHRWADSAYSYFDFFAGPGLYNADDHAGLAGEYGSPVRALRILGDVFHGKSEEAANGEPLGIRSFLYDPEAWHRLEFCLRSLGLRGGGGIISDQRCEEAIPELISGWTTLTGLSPWKPLGLAFFDPNGMPPWSSIRAFASERPFHRIDLLININSTVGKRVRKSPLHAESLTPTEHLMELGKDEVYLWEPAPGDIHQFALAYCTNGKFPEFRRLGFHFINSDKGRRIANRIDMTAEERNSLGSPGFLPGMEGI